MKALSFKIGVDAFALSFNHIQKVVESPELNPIPLAPSFFLGALNFHNHIIPILNLTAYLDVFSQERDSRIIVLDLRHHRLGLAVGKIEGKMNLAEIKALPGVPSSLLSKVSRLVALEDGSPVRILEPADLKNHLTATILAKRRRGDDLSPSVLPFAQQKKPEDFSSITGCPDLPADLEISCNPKSNSR